MKILIIEDEALIASRLERMLLSVDPSVEIVGKLGSVASVRDFFTLRPHDVDLIMSDIRLGDGLVFDALSSIDDKPHVVFVTAYDEYAVKAFKYNGIDYILKPPSAEDLTMALQRARQLGGTVSPSAMLSEINRTTSVQYRRRFMAETGVGVHRLIDVDNIALFYIEYGQVWFRTFDGLKATVEESLDRLSAELDPAKFFRVNRQHIVNIGAIKETKMLWSRKLRLILDDVVGYSGDIVASREKISVLRQWLKGIE
ncbi:MAG: LytTR family DNA-binding domain-containing protein [Muribaculum sp.]|nr:LytTR family DNA-binding domain-containing protein [Muribaculum sp.]